MNIVFRPSDCLTQVIGSCGKAVIAAWKIGKSPHRALSVFPNEPEIDIPDVVRRTVESRATPSLSERLRIGGLRDTDDDSRGIFHVPCDTAVGSAKCAKVGEQTVSPQRSVPVPIRQSGIACHPGLVINTISPVARSAKPGEVRHLVLQLCLCLQWSLRKH